MHVIQNYVRNIMFGSLVCLLMFSPLCHVRCIFLDEQSPDKSPPPKKRSYKLPEKTKQLLDADTANIKLWSEVITGLHDYPVIALYLSAL